MVDVGCTAAQRGLANGRMLHEVILLVHHGLCAPDEQDRIYNEIPDEIDGDDNLDKEPAQIPNRKAVDVVEASSLNYTVLRPGYLGEGDEDDYVLTVKGEAAKGYTTPIPALVKFAVQLIMDDLLYSRESVSITHDATKDISK